MGGDGFAKVKLRAGGAHLVLPGPVSPGYFTMDPKVVVQLSNRSGKCWTSEFPNATRSDVEGFSAKSP